MSQCGYSVCKECAEREALAWEKGFEAAEAAYSRRLAELEAQYARELASLEDHVHELERYP